MTMTATSSAENSAPLVGNVPSPGAIVRLPAIDPAIARHGAIIAKRPMNITAARVRFQKGVLAASPANADPLLPAPLLNA